MDGALTLALWFSIVRPPVFAPSDLTRVAESHARERAQIRKAIALSASITHAEALARSAAASEIGGSVSGLVVVNGQIVR